MPEAVEHFVFDAFGTLFDVHSAARAHAALIGSQWPRVSDIWRAKQLEYSFIHAGIGSHIPFAEATRQGLAYALGVCGLDPALVSIAEDYARLEAYPEVGQVLAALKGRGARLAILSNGDPETLASLVAHAKLSQLLDAVISVSAAGTFKPNPRVYDLACQRFGQEPGAITFISSNRWDIAGSKAFGFRPVWINRSGARDEYPHLPPERVVSDLTKLL